MGDHLRQHRVVVAADVHAGGQTGIDAHAGHLGFDHVEHRATGGQEAASRILGVHPRLDRVTVQRDVVLRDGKLLAGRDPNLPLDQVPPGDHLRHRVLDLQAGVHLEEEELVGPVRGDDEFDCAGAGVVDAAGGVTGRGPDAGPRRVVEQR